MAKYVCIITKRPVQIFDPSGSLVTTIPENVPLMDDEGGHYYSFEEISNDISNGKGIFYDYDCLSNEVYDAISETFFSYNPSDSIKNLSQEGYYKLNGISDFTNFKLA